MSLRRLLPALMLLVAALALAGCGGDDGDGGGDGDGSSAGGEDASATFTLGEFYINPSEESVPAGELTFAVENEGSVTHELIIYRSDEEPGDLPLTDDGVAELDEADVMVEVHDIEGGASDTATVDLEPGSYILLCNLPGHYTSGQVAAFEVT